MIRPSYSILFIYKNILVTLFCHFTPAICYYKNKYFLFGAVFTKYFNLNLWNIFPLTPSKLCDHSGHVFILVGEKVFQNRLSFIC